MTSPKPFSEWLHQQRDGFTHDELTKAMAELLLAVSSTGRSGTITLQIKVGCIGKSGRQMEVSDKVTLKLPKPDQDSSIFFFDEDALGLTRNDPLQPSLPLLEVKRRELREVSAPADPADQSA